MGVVADFEAELLAKSPAKYGQWFLVDLHNHSPVSFDYLGNRTTAVEATADRIRAAGLSIVMFTDHAKLPDAVFTQELSKRTNCTILRGIELNVFVDAWSKPEGKVDKNLFFHLLVGFDPELTQGPEYWVDHIYKSCGDATRESGSTWVRGVTKGIDAVMKALEGSNAIVIPAHLHSSRDAFKSRSIDDLYADPEFLRHAKEHFTALEVTDVRTAEFFDGNHAETTGLEKSCIRSSDAHEPQRLGTRATFVQMERPSFAELKAALEMPFRISLAEPKAPNSYIIGMRIRGQFYQDLWLKLSANCNAFIGVKGSGKTSVLEALRFALGSPVPVSKQETVKSHLNNILGSAGSVQALVKRGDGAKLLIERSAQSPDYRITFEDNRQEVLTSPDGLLFPSYILGWHEIEQAATDPNIRQVYLDTIAGRDQIRSMREAANVAMKAILYQHEIAATKYATFRALSEQVKSLEELRKGLQELTDGNLIALRNEFETALRHRDAVDELSRTLQGADDELQSRMGALGIPANPDTFDGQSPIGQFASESLGMVQALAGTLDSFSGTYRAELQGVIGKVELIRAQMGEKFDVFLREYETKLSGLAPEKRQLLESHRRVMEDTKALPRLRSEQEGHKRDLEAVLKELANLCEHVAEQLDKRTALRVQRVAELNTELLKFDVQLEVDPLSVRSRLDSLSQQFTAGAKVYQGVSSLAPGERRSHRRLEKVYEGLRADLLGGSRLIFDSPEFNNFVEYFEEDDLKIRFKVGKAGEEFSPIDQLSAGQRCTAVFPLLLRLQEGPLIVDQPEDNLDNRHIADVIAPALREDKKARQIAFTSHNANLVVLTDAEHIATFESNGSAGRIERRGFLCASHSEIAKDVIAILDGGTRALQLRYRKYGMPTSQP
jgi:hypothetical protein